MKKLILALIIVALCAGVAYAALPADPDRRVSTYVCTGTGAGVGDDEFISTNTINSNDLILGYKLIAGEASKSAGCSLYDCAAVTSYATSTQIDESETIANGTSVETWFPYPYQISTQLGVHIGDTDTIVIIYYEDK